ncbi:hypothetical protein evm_014811, partial [Chilo suppressalis]
MYATMQVYRYSRTAKYTLYEIETENWFHVAGHARLQLCIFGGNHSLAYVLDNNLYYLSEDNETIAITDDGIVGVVYNGHTDWVYEEDVMYTGQATWFSPDGNYWRFASFNDHKWGPTRITIMRTRATLTICILELVNLKYPKSINAPTAEAQAFSVECIDFAHQMGIVPKWSCIKLNNIPQRAFWHEAPTEVTEDHILWGVTWPTQNEWLLIWLNREQNFTVSDLRCYQHECVQEIRSEPNGWVPIALPRFSRDGSFYMQLRWSERQPSGYIWQHLFRIQRTADDFNSSSLTPGDFTVNNYVGMDEDNDAFYYTRTVTGQPWQTQLRRLSGGNDICLSCVIVMPERGQCTWATATLSQSGRYMSVTCSSPTEPSATFLLEPL